MPAPLRVTFCKRRKTLFSKASKLCELAGARAAVIVFSRTGRLYSSGDLVEETAQIISDYVSCYGGAMPPMGLKEKADWVRKQSRRTEIAKSADRVRMLWSFINRLETLCNKATELCRKTKARAAVIVFPNTGSLYSDTEIPFCFGIPSVEDVISDWVEKQLKSCVMEDIDSLRLKYEAVLRYVMREKLKDISGSGNSGVGADCDSEGLNDDDIDSLLQSFEASHPLLFAHFKDYVRDSLLTAPVNSAVASGSSGKEPTQNLSENNPSVNDDLPQSLLERFDTGGDGFVIENSFLLELLHQETLNFDPDYFLNLSEDFDHDGFLTLPENSAVGGGSPREEPMRSDLEGYGYNPDVFVALEDLDVSLVI